MNPSSKPPGASRGRIFPYKPPGASRGRVRVKIGAGNVRSGYHILPLLAHGGFYAAYHSHQLPVATTYAPSARFVPAWASTQSIGFRVAAAIPLTTANHPTAATASAGWLAAA